jgi:hypothetical protein
MFNQTDKTTRFSPPPSRALFFYVSPTCHVIYDCAFFFIIKVKRRVRNAMVDEAHMTTTTAMMMMMMRGE